MFVDKTSICRKSVCEFDLVVTRGRTMTYRTESATYNVAMHGEELRIVANSYHKATDDRLINTAVDPNRVITADGHPMNVLLVNGKFPGEPIQVVYGAQASLLPHSPPQQPTGSLLISPVTSKLRYLPPSSL